MTHKHGPRTRKPRKANTAREHHNYTQSHHRGTHQHQVAHGPTSRHGVGHHGKSGSHPHSQKHRHTLKAHHKRALLRLQSHHTVNGIEYDGNTGQPMARIASGHLIPLDMTAKEYRDATRV